VEEKTKLTERVTEQLQKYFRAHTTSPTSISDFNRSLSILMTSVANEAYKAGVEYGREPRAAKANVAPPEILEAHTVQRIAEGMQNNYAHTRKAYDLLTSMRETEDWADTRDRIKRLGFTFANAVAIAVVILCTSWIASKANIPLPMMRMPM
jgi:hypothetical protein